MYCKSASRIDINPSMTSAYKKDNPPQVHVGNTLCRRDLIGAYGSIERITREEILSGDVFENRLTVNRPSASRVRVPKRFKLKKKNFVERTE